MNYEVEVKSLLGSIEAADDLLQMMARRDTSLHMVDQQEQLSHYFIGTSLEKLANHVRPYFEPHIYDQLDTIRKSAASFSVRSRQKNGRCFLIVKGAMDGGSAVHGIKRMEFEQPLDMHIDELDALLLSSNLRLEAKWSANRKMYAYKGLTVDMMFTPGYGYVVELEKVVAEEAAAEDARQQILHEMAELDISELDPNRLQRMFEYYNAHWSEYYGTQKVFTIK